MKTRTSDDTAATQPDRMAKKSETDDASLFNNDAFSDLTVQFSGHSVKVHRAVLFQASGWFRHALQSDFKVKRDHLPRSGLHANGGSSKESSATVIELCDDDPDALRLVLELCYREVDDLCACLAGQSLWDLYLLVKIFLVADKYEIRRYQAKILDRVRILCSSEDFDELRETFNYLPALDLAHSNVVTTSSRLQEYLFEGISTNLRSAVFDEENRLQLEPLFSKHASLGAALFNSLVPNDEDDESECQSFARLCYRCQKCGSVFVNRVVLNAYSSGLTDNSLGDYCPACGDAHSCVMPLSSTWVVGRTLCIRDEDTVF